MMLIVTNDSFLALGFKFLYDENRVIHVSDIGEADMKIIVKSRFVIIDLYYNNILNKAEMEKIKQIEVGRIIILSPFRISKIKGSSPFFFINRNESLAGLISIFSRGHFFYKKPSLAFSENQLKIINLVVNEFNDTDIKRMLKISTQTLRIQKFNVMFKLKIRKMYEVVTLKVSSYF